jgi:glycerol-3-phosphate acyltransferase PlsY
MILNNLLVVFAYLLGSIPTGLVLSRALAGKDPRQQGSRNIGATNVLRTVGRTTGVITLIGDALKGIIPVVIALWLVKEEFWIVGTGMAAFLGHCFPVYLRFKGGKGVATALGIFIPLAPVAVVLDVFFFAGVVVTSRIVSIGSLLGAVAMPILIWLLKYPLPYIALGICVALLIIYRHKENIKRLLAGRENRLWGRS